MSLQYIIDAYNLVNHPQFKPAKQSVNIVYALVNFIKLNQLIGSKNNKAVLVFDGFPPANQEIPEVDGLTCVFSYEIEADESIKRMVEACAYPKNIIVVSDDKQVKLMSKILNAQVLGVEEFICGKNDRKLSFKQELDANDPKLNYAQMHKVNEELKKKWLK
ncbi:MAG: NYN domain-containing protein [Candidatus Omnitrophota bacterium]